MNYKPHGDHRIVHECHMHWLSFCSLTNQWASSLLLSRLNKDIPKSMFFWSFSSCTASSLRPGTDNSSKLQTITIRTLGTEHGIRTKVRGPLEGDGQRVSTGITNTFSLSCPVSTPGLWASPSVLVLALSHVNQTCDAPCENILNFTEHIPPVFEILKVFSWIKSWGCFDLLNIK